LVENRLRWVEHVDRKPVDVVVRSGGTFAPYIKIKNKKNTRKI